MSTTKTYTMKPEYASKQSVPESLKLLILGCKEIPSVTYDINYNVATYVHLVTDYCHNGNGPACIFWMFSSEPPTKGEYELLSESKKFDYSED